MIPLKLQEPTFKELIIIVFLDSGGRLMGILSEKVTQPFSFSGKIMSSI